MRSRFRKIVSCLFILELIMTSLGFCGHVHLPPFQDDFSVAGYEWGSPEHGESASSHHAEPDSEHVCPCLGNRVAVIIAFYLPVFLESQWLVPENTPLPSGLSKASIDRPPIVPLY